MAVTAEAVKMLRERTGAGMMECKKALVETNGDLDAATELMRKAGLAKADKKAARIAAEGVIVIERSADAKRAAIVEVNCETDFVARERDFQNFAAAVAKAALAKRPAHMDALLAAPLEGGKTIEETRRELVAKIGENIGVRRFALIEAPSVVGAYLHGTRIGALVAMKSGDEAVAKDIAMHIAAINPARVSAAEVPQDEVAREREIFVEQAKGDPKTAGKPQEHRRQDRRGQGAQVDQRDHVAGPAVREGRQAVGRAVSQQRRRRGGLDRPLRGRRGHREEAGRLRRGSAQAGRKHEVAARCATGALTASRLTPQ